MRGNASYNSKQVDNDMMLGFLVEHMKAVLSVVLSC